MSNPIDDSSFAAASNTGEKAAHLMAVQSPLSPVDSSEDTKKWDELALKLQEVCVLYINKKYTQILVS